MYFYFSDKHHSCGPIDGLRREFKSYSSIIQELFFRIYEFSLEFRCLRPQTDEDVDLLSFAWSATHNNVQEKHWMGKWGISGGWIYLTVVAPGMYITFGNLTSNSEDQSLN